MPDLDSILLGYTVVMFGIDISLSRILVELLSVVLALVLLIPVCSLLFLSWINDFLIEVTAFLNPPHHPGYICSRRD